MKLTVGEILIATGGRLQKGAFDAVVAGVSTDSRTLRGGEAFVALKGEKHDAHDHLAEVAKKGAAAVVVAADVPADVSGDIANVVRVDDTLKALGDLARYWRRKFDIPVVGVTGSNGKTTAKDLIAAVLGVRYRVFKTEGNFNNLVGLPLTVFRMRGDEDVAVLEMGMNRLGEIDRLAEIAGPDVAVITTVARAHLEGLGHLSNVARAKGEILDHLPCGGLAVLPADNVYFDVLQEKARRRGARVVGFGEGKNAGVRAVSARVEGLSAVGFEARWDGGRGSFRLSAAGRHNVWNALAALAVGVHFQVPVAGIQKAMARFQTGAKRMEIVSVGREIDVINDCYNANPDSTIASLGFLRDFGRWRKHRRTVAVIGEMLELGKFSKSLHAEVGRAAAKSGVSLLVAVGPHAEDMASAARRAGLGRDRTFAFANAQDAMPLVKSVLRNGDVVLVKGSRGMKMERITEGLEQERTF